MNSQYVIPVVLMTLSGRADFFSRKSRAAVLYLTSVKIEFDLDLLNAASSHPSINFTRKFKIIILFYEVNQPKVRHTIYYEIQTIQKYK